MPWLLGLLRLSALTVRSRLALTDVDLSAHRFAKHAGSRLERVTPAGRGGGVHKKKSPAAVVAAIRKDLGRAARIAADMQTLRTALQEGRGIAGVEGLRRKTKLAVGRVRAALARLDGAGEVENLGTDRHPRLRWKQLK